MFLRTLPPDMFPLRIAQDAVIVGPDACRIGIAPRRSLNIALRPSLAVPLAYLTFHGELYEVILRVNSAEGMKLFDVFKAAFGEPQKNPADSEGKLWDGAKAQCFIHLDPTADETVVVIEDKSRINAGVAEKKASAEKAAKGL